MFRNRMGNGVGCCVLGVGIFAEHVSGHGHKHIDEESHPPSPRSVFSTHLAAVTSNVRSAGPMVWLHGKTD